MHEGAALARIEARARRLDRLRVQAKRHETAEGTSRLVAKEARPSARGVDGRRRPGRIHHRLQPGANAITHQAQRARGEIFEHDLRERSNQRAGRKLRLVAHARVAHHHFAGGLQPALGDAPIELQRRDRIRLRNAGDALKADREERIGTRGKRPPVIRETHHPQVVELEARGLENSEDPDRHFVAFRLEDRVARHGRDQLARAVVAERGRDPLERGEFGEQIVPALQGLVLVRIESALAGEAGGTEQFGECARPLRCGSLRLAHRSARLGEPFQDVDQSRRRRRLRRSALAHEPFQRGD